MAVLICLEYGTIAEKIIIRVLILLSIVFYVGSDEKRKFEIADHTFLMQIVKLLFSCLFAVCMVVVMFNLDY